MEIHSGSAQIPGGTKKKDNSSAYGCFCKRKLDLLRVFSTRTDLLSVAAAHFASLAGNTNSLGALAETKKEYEKEKAETHEAYQNYFNHCIEHGC